MENSEMLKEIRKGWTGDKLQLIIDEWNANPVAAELDEIPDVELEEPEVQGE